MDTIQNIQLIATNPKIRGGRPYIIGTTLTVADVAIAKVFHMLDADEIADHYNLSLPQVYGALAYYYVIKPTLTRALKNGVNSRKN